MKSEGVNVQCQKCGTIFQVDEREDKVEKIYIHAQCPCCEHDGNMLNIGKNILDKYALYDVTMDERYYIY